MLIVMVLMGTVMLMMTRRSVCHLGCWGGEVHCNEIAPGVPAGDQVGSFPTVMLVTRKVGGEIVMINC